MEAFFKYVADCVLQEAAEEERNSKDSSVGELVLRNLSEAVHCYCNECAAASVYRQAGACQKASVNESVVLDVLEGYFNAPAYE